MTAAATILTIALFGLASGPIAPLTIVDEAERVWLAPASAASVRVEALTGEIFLRPRKGTDTGALLKALGQSRICPLSLRSGAEVVLRCATKKLDVALAMDGRALDLRRLRGLPWRDADDGPPRLTYDPREVGLGDECPGDTAAGRGECALAAGQRTLAERFFTEAYGTVEQHSPAALRLGDLALARNDVKAALELYQQAGAAGPFGQLAVQRRHELLGLPARQLYLDRSRMPEVMLTEVDLRHARELAFAGFEGEAAQLLEARLGSSGNLCSATDQLCRRLLLFALRSKDGDARAAGLSLYSALPARAQGKLSAELARAAAEVAAELGAPLYGANALAATVRAAPAASLGQHLLRAAELFDAADQPARRDVILEYAKLKLSAGELESPAFRRLLDQPRKSRAASAQKSARDTAAASSSAAATAAQPDAELAAAKAALQAAQGSGTDPATQIGNGATTQEGKP